ncbi:MAG: PLDc N-terminal domain-containing protein [Desulfohalobiaceae bacterium]
MLELSALQLTVVILALLLPILPNLWAIWHIFHCDFPTAQEKMAWLVAAMFLPVLGGIVYLLLGRKRAKRVV